jgi:hypothetical protein
MGGGLILAKKSLSTACIALCLGRLSTINLSMRESYGMRAPHSSQKAIYYRVLELTTRVGVDANC